MAAIRPTYVLWIEKINMEIECVGPFEWPERVQDYIDSLPPNYANRTEILTVTPALQQDRIARIRFHSQV